MISVIRKLHHILDSYQRRTALLLLLLMIVSMGLETLGIGLVIPAVALLMQDDLVARYPIIAPALDVLGNPDQKSLIIAAMIGLAVIYLAKNVFIAFLVWRQMRFAYGVQARLSQNLFDTYLRQPYTFHLQRNSAQLIRNAVVEVGQFTNTCLLPGMLLLSEGLVLLGLAGLLIVIEPLGAITIIAILGLASWIFHQGTRARTIRWGEARQYHEGLRIQHLQQGLSGAKDVKILGREADFLAQYKIHNFRSASVAQGQATLVQLPRLWLELLAITCLAILVVTLILQGREPVTIVPILGLFAAAAFRLLPSANRMLGAAQACRFGLPVISMLYEELKLETPASETRSTETTSGCRDEIQITNVTYTFPGGARPALNGISVEIKRGESIGIIGPSGSGKSTLVDVLLGLLSPDAGQVRVDGQDIRRNMREWQNQIGYVPQTIYLTDDTLRRNIAFGLPNERINHSAVQSAIRSAQLEKFVEELPNGLETIVGERGVRLSGGQRQRIGIARALYHDPDVLVLDEATSSLDLATEQEVMRAVTALHGKKTVIIVAHRHSTVKNCDRLYKLEKGRLTVADLTGSNFMEASGGT